MFLSCSFRHCKDPDVQIIVEKNIYLYLYSFNKLSNKQTSRAKGSKDKKMIEKTDTIEQIWNIIRKDMSFLH